MRHFSYIFFLAKMTKDIMNEATRGRNLRRRSCSLKANPASLLPASICIFVFAYKCSVNFCFDTYININNSNFSNKYNKVSVIRTIIQILNGFRTWNR